MASPKNCRGDRPGECRNAVDVPGEQGPDVMAGRSARPVCPAGGGHSGCVLLLKEPGGVTARSCLWEHTSWSIHDLPLIVLIALWAIAAVFAVLVLALLDSLARAVLPPRLRDRYWHPYARNPEKCPACGGTLVVREVRTPSTLRDRRSGKTLDQITYEGTCSDCAKVFQWVNLGKVAPVLLEIHAQALPR